ncbi:hypothetical protein ABIE26_002956 [Pedobacter africanus]|uniref:hypothetical protein n=1 Tax=Pedobacter africanus TaxID=151894 RepID=UPI003394F9F7
MLNGISWGQFFMVAGVLLAVYYLLLLKPWKNARRRHDAPQPVLPGSGEAMAEEQEFPEDMAEPNENELGVAEELAGRLREIIGQTGQGNFVRAELLVDLQEEIALYPFLNNDMYRAAFNELVRDEVQKKCAVVLSERELDGLWE